jgi:hypothetical protein
MDSGALENGANGTTSDNTSSSRRRTKQNDTGRCFTLDGVRNSESRARNAEEVLLRVFDALRDREGNFAGLAVADTDESVTVTDDDESGERKAATTLDDLRNAVDRNDLLEEGALLNFTATAVITTTGPSATTVVSVFATATTRSGLLGRRRFYRLGGSCRFY